METERQFKAGKRPTRQQGMTAEGQKGNLKEEMKKWRQAIRASLERYYAWGKAEKVNGGKHEAVEFREGKST